ncbi:hypothetical protein B0A55_04746 [Friedmanniomyces simplex]|uniref:Uncharacterized protein n=1 Tax=Friedmanniomyces simplex TaxID=329884 RepID=A0A4U0XLV3_9PEZI|nr:hypothetical protein B0A55_04746 [Friedmanniomyces simplex]
MANESHYTNLVEESKLVHCCTRSLRDGLWSGLLGTLQKYGYTELNRASIVAAFRDACHILIQLQGSGENYPSIKGLLNHEEDSEQQVDEAWERTCKATEAG